MTKYIIDEKYVYLPLNKVVLRLNHALAQNDIEGILSSNWAKSLTNYESELLRKPDDSCTFENMHPYNLGILPTNECNLRCKYCYSETGEKPKQSLSQLQIKTYINLLVKNAVLHSIIQKGRVEAKLVISGGGEPTFQWDNFKFIVEYFSAMCLEHNIGKRIILITNGVMNSANADYVINNVDQINLSADGFPAIQNTQRPTTNGNESFSYVDRFIRKCEKYGKDILVRATVLSQNFGKLNEISSYFFEHYHNVTTLHFEPLFYVGRGSRYGDEQYKLLPQFLDSYISAYQHIEQFYPGKKLHNASFSYQLQEYFCSASLGLNPWLHMDGNVLPCTDHVESPDLVVAKVHEDRVHINHSFTKMIYNLEKCKECFAYYHCGGGCPHNIEKDENGNNLNSQSEAYCAMVAEYWRRAIISIGEGKSFCGLRPVALSTGEYGHIFNAYRIEH